MRDVRVARSRDGDARATSPRPRWGSATTRSRLQRTGEIARVGGVHAWRPASPEALRAIARALARVSQAHAAARRAERRLHLPESRPGARPRARRHPVRRPARSSIAPASRAARVGGAQVSPLHGNFIVRDGAATARDIRALVERCQQRRASSASASAARRGRLPRRVRLIRSDRLDITMSTLLIEGGRRLSGRITVDGNKNAALPLLAACLLTRRDVRARRTCRASRDVARDGRPARPALGADVEGGGTSTLDDHVPRRSTSDTPDPKLVGRLRGSVLLMGPLLAPDRPRAPRAARAATSRRGARSPRTCRRWSRWARASSRESGYELDAPDGLHGRVVLSRRGVGHRHRDGAARRGRGRGRRPRFATPRPSRTSSSCASSCRRWACRSKAPARRRSASQGAARRKRRDARAARRLHRSRQLGGRRRPSPAATSRSRGVRAVDLEPITAVLQRMKLQLRAATTTASRSTSRALEAIGRLTTGLWPGFPSDMVSLVTVLATQAEGETLIHDWMYELRLFALEQLQRDARRSLPLRPAPHRRVRADQAARPRARQPRPAIGHGADRRGAGGRGPEHARAARDRRARLRATSSSACKSLGAAVEVAPS